MFDNKTPTDIVMANTDILVELPATPDGMIG